MVQLYAFAPSEPVANTTTWLCTPADTLSFVHAYLPPVCTHSHFCPKSEHEDEGMCFAGYASATTYVLIVMLLYHVQQDMVSEGGAWGWVVFLWQGPSTYTCTFSYWSLHMVCHLGRLRSCTCVHAAP